MKSSFKILLRFGLILLGGGILTAFLWCVGGGCPKGNLHVTWTDLWCIVSGCLQGIIRGVRVVFQYLAVCAGFASAFVAFSYAFRHLILGFAVTAGMIVFGLSVYHGPGRTKPSPEVNNEPVAHVVAVADNALSAFFMSRGGYDDFGHESSPSSVPDILWTNVTASLKASSNETAQVAIANAIEKSLTPSETDEKKASESYGDSGIKWYYLFHALSYAFGAAVLGAVFAHRLMNLMFIRILQFRKFAVFWGVCDEAQTVADSMRVIRPIFAFLERKPFVLKRDPTPAEARLNEGSYLWAYVDPDTLKGAFGKLLRRGASEHYFVSPDGQANVAAADVLLKDLENVKAKPKVFVRIDADAEEDVLFKWADSWAEKFKGEIILVHEPSLVAKSLVRKYPMWEVPGIEIDSTVGMVKENKGDFRILLVGYGAQGKALLREMVQNGVLPGATINATIVDQSPNAYALFETYLASEKDIIDNSDPSDPAFPVKFVFMTLDVRSERFEKWLDVEIENAAEQGKLPWNRVVLALPDDLANLRLGIHIAEKYKKHDFTDIVAKSPIFFVGVRRNANVRYSSPILKKIAQGGIVQYGDLCELYGKLDYIFTCGDAAAKYRSWSYENKGLPYSMYISAGCPGKPWNKSSFFDKESTRDAVAGLRTLVRLCGFNIIDSEVNLREALQDEGLKDVANAVASLKSDPVKLRNLAMAEHLRWNAFHIMRRISPWYPTESEWNQLIKDAKEKTTEKNINYQLIKENDRQNHWRHAALVPYNDLPGVAKRFRDANTAAGHPYTKNVDKEDERTTLSMTDTLYLTNWKFVLIPAALG